MKEKEKTVYGLIGSILLLILIVSTSYAYIKLNKEEREVNVLGTDCIKLEMKEESEGITLHHAYPVTDETGQASTPYTFKLTNECGVGVDYEIHLRVEDGSTIDASNIATSVDGQSKVKLIEQVTTEEEQEEYKISNKLSLKPYEEVEHNIRIWLDKDAGNETQNGIFKSKVVIEAIQNQTAIYTEKILNGADPVLYDAKEEPLAMLTANEEEPTITDTLVPVKINETNGEVTKADVTQEWYNYEKKEWANAVILVDNERAKTLKAGDKIEENEIESYFVWIPKYRYKIFDMGHYETASVTELQDKGSTTVIDIEFGLENTIDDTTNENYKQCATPNASGADGQCHEGYWMTHPAFTAFPDSKGFWVGKFETGYNQDETNSNTINVTESWTTNGANKDENDSTKVIIKPNVYSWRNITVGNAFKTSYNYERELDSHMMKNTEWGAVAYLSNSKYGRCNNGTCEEVRLNNSQNGVTGYAAKEAPILSFDTGDYGNVTLGQDASINGNFQGAYNYTNKASNIASSTENYSGIYDLSGSSWELVMAAVTSANRAEDASLENIQQESSGLNFKDDIKDKKYIDLYINGTFTQYNRRKLGDATGEMGPFLSRTNERNVGSWYKDMSFYPDARINTFIRGGAYQQGTDGGIFEFSGSDVVKRGDFSFRIVLIPTNDAL